MTTKPRPDFTTLGDSGLYRSGGYVFEEYLAELRGERGRRILAEMIRGDAIIGGILFAIDMMIRRLEWRVDPASDDPEAQKWATRVDEARNDMELSWVETISEAASFIPYGWAVMEIDYKICQGDSEDPTRASRYDDGVIAWRRWGIRSQDTLLHWVFEPDGTPTAMVQLNPYIGFSATIPLDKCLHFKTVERKHNPEGMALDPDTMIPTPDGWRMLDDIQPGDKVFDEEGKVRYVTARADWQNRQCFELTFNDKSTIIADEAHQWMTQLVHERATRKPAKIRTTAQIALSVKNGNDVSNHSIAWAGALDYPKQILPVDPYYLGQWLGNGTAATSCITSHVDDAGEVAELVAASAGYTTTVTGNGDKNGNGRLVRVYGDKKWDSRGPSQALRSINVINNKHIPEVYLRGSIHQRREFLAGLMDSDGTVDLWGRCEFVNTNRSLIDGVAELVRSLGVGATITDHHYVNRMENHMTTWRVKFTPPWSPFRLERKTAKTINARARQNHYIVSATPVAPRRTVCIEVDAPSHLFLAGTSMIPTHNSAIRNAYNSWYYKKSIQKLEAIGIERNWVGIPVAELPADYLSPSASPAQQATAATIKGIVTNLRNDEQAGILWPSDRDEAGNPLFVLKLMQTGGAPTVDTDRVVQRHNHDIARSVLAGFIFLADGQGSYALSVNQTGFFARALGAWVNHMAEVITKGAIAPMMRYNGVLAEHWPVLNHGEIGDVDAAGMAETLLSLAQAGLLDVADPDLRKFVSDTFGLPAPVQTDEQAEEEEGGGDTDQEDATADPNDPTADGPIKKLPAKEQMPVPEETPPATKAKPAPKGKSAKAKAAVEPSAIDAALARFEQVKTLKGLLSAEVAA